MKVTVVFTLKKQTGKTCEEDMVYTSLEELIAGMGNEVYTEDEDGEESVYEITDISQG